MSQNDDAHGPTHDQDPLSGHELAKPDAGHHDEQSNAKYNRADVGRNPTKGEILRNLNALPQLVALGVLTPAKSNAMRASYQTMLSHLGPAPSGGETQLGDAELMALRDHPTVWNLLEPLLSDQTIATIMSRFKDEPDPQQ